MDILLKTAGWTWSDICDCLQAITPLCRNAPHFIWCVGPVPRHHAADLPLLVRQLDLEDHFAQIPDSDPELPASAFEFRKDRSGTDWQGQLTVAAGSLGQTA